MTGRINTKLAWVVATGMLWAWAGLLLALAPPQRGAPLLDVALRPGEGGIVLQGGLAELVEDGSGIHLKLHFRGGPEGPAEPPPLPKLPPGISVEYLPPDAPPQRPHFEIQHGFGPIRRPTGGALVAVREYIFQIERGQVRIVVAPPGSPLRERLERMGGGHERLGEREGPPDEGPPPPDRLEERRQRRRERREERLPGGP